VYEMAQEQTATAEFAIRRAAEKAEDEDLRKILEPLYRKAEETGQSEDEEFQNTAEALYDTAVKLRRDIEARRTSIANAVAGERPLSDEVRRVDAELRGYTVGSAITLPVWFIRALFEFLLPILVGSFAIYALLSG
jgi:hypothetical protein